MHMYTVAVAYDQESIEQSVRKMMAAGYEPVGGVSIACREPVKVLEDDLGYVFAQAMVKPSEEG